LRDLSPLNEDFMADGGARTPDQGQSKPRARWPLVMADECSEPSQGVTCGLNRRDFLKAAGFTFAGALLPGCSRAPEEQAIPPLIQLPDIIPGRALYYASTCAGCSAGCGLLVKTLDGRPIKLEGNPDHPVSKGGLCAVGQGSLLGLYDRLRLQHPTKDGQQATWDEVDRGIRCQLDAIKSQGGAVRVLSGTITSPTTRVWLQRFLDNFADARHVVYDPLSSSAVLDAHESTHGVRVLPRYHFDKAEIILAVDADFLGTWIAPVPFAAGYKQGRTLSGSRPRLSRHIHVESRLSLTGSKADERVCIAPHEITSLIVCLAAKLARRAGVPFDAGDPGTPVHGLPPSLLDLCDGLAQSLWQARQRSLVVCGSQDVAVQAVCNFINHLLDNYGSTLDIELPSYQRQESDRQLETLLRELYDGKVAALLILDGNPVYDLPDGERLAKALQQLPLVVSCPERLDETARASRYVCPRPHYLEDWSDSEPVSGAISLEQPTIPRLGGTRSILESLAVWSGKPKTAYALLREHWEAEIFPRQAGVRSFQKFWDNSLHDSYASVTPMRARPKPFNVDAVRAALKRIPSRSPKREGREAGREILAVDLVLYPKVGILDGKHAYNPWLQELPDPISKVAWDNYACLSPATAAEWSLGEGDLVQIQLSRSEGKALTLPVFIQPGQHDRVVAVALGYGSLASHRFADIGPKWVGARPTLGDSGLVGRNAAPLIAWEDGTLRYIRTEVKLTKMGGKHPLASTQDHHSLTLPSHLAPPQQARRPIIQETTLAALAEGGATEPVHEKHGELWPADHPNPEHHWGMAIDLNACTACSACVIACQVENNIPVVGKDEVMRHRELHWLRIDRYYSGSGSDVDVAYQPMLCQHCERAPCETVCPVLATVHSDEGLNQQVYNRCVGTRYCANNCPYKVRRFNWFAYAHDDSMQNLALNPDVTVRSRGVMEKCTFCVQRIQEARLEAKRRGVQVRDGELQTACQQSCPARAITFGDLRDPKSQVARLRKDPRHYHVLGELNIGPSVGYLKVVRNRSTKDEGEKT
jgi:molybdopterin-containing oxidoreductase family iron-sulfur binding subunit